jgi:hypothetical protein
MRLNKYLTEKWAKSFKMKGRGLRDDILEVFVNPTKSEFRDAAGTNDFDMLKGKWVRFFADMEKRQVHIWNPEVIHLEAWKRFGDSRKFTDVTLVKGVAENVGGKWVFTESDEGVERNLRHYSWEDWKWADKWINVTKYLKRWVDNRKSEKKAIEARWG